MSSDLLDKLIKALTVLPGVGKKSAQRMASVSYTHLRAHET